MKPKKIKNPWKVAMGHQGHDLGCGRHQDRREKRKRTRRAAVAAAIREYA